MRTRTWTQRAGCCRRLSVGREQPEHVAAEAAADHPRAGRPGLAKSARDGFDGGVETS